MEQEQDLKEWKIKCCHQHIWYADQGGPHFPHGVIHEAEDNVFFFVEEGIWYN